MSQLSQPGPQPGFDREKIAVTTFAMHRGSCYPSQRAHRLVSSPDTHGAADVFTETGALRDVIGCVLASPCSPLRPILVCMFTAFEGAAEGSL